MFTGRSLSWLQTLAPTVGWRSHAVTIAVCTAILLIPGILNGRPFLFPDSQQYFLVGQRAVEIVFGASPVAELGAADAIAPSATSDTPSDAAPAPGSTSGGTAATASDDGGLAAIAGGRSALYSILLYVASAKLSMWLVAALQAALVAWLVVRFCDFAFRQRRPGPTMLVTAALTALTPLGFHVSFMMPDVFAGCLVLAMVLLVFAKDAGRAERLAYAAVIAVAVNVHTTNVLLGLASLAIIVALRLWPPTAGSTRRHATRQLGAAIAAAVLANVAVGLVTKLVTGDDVVTPPYLMARVFADGPGETLLADACAADQNAYAACIFDGVGIGDESDLLWNGTAERPSFVTSPLALRAALKREERAFVIDAIGHDPLGQIAASTRNVVQQLQRFGIPEVRFGAEAQAIDPGWTNRAILRHAPGFPECLTARFPCHRYKVIAMAWGDDFEVVTGVAVAAFLVVLGLWLYARTRQPEIWKAHDPLLLGALVICAIVLCNAVICGVLSGAQDRYQSRLIWLAPLFLMSTSAVWRRLFLRQPDASGAIPISRPKL